jgi:hypothetical protein
LGVEQLGSLDPGRHFCFGAGVVGIVVVGAGLVGAGVEPQATGFSHFSHLGASLHAAHSLGAGQVGSATFPHLAS